MKRAFYYLLALATVFASCEKEQEIDNKVSDINNLSTIPTQIKASVEDVFSKTSYAEDGSFTWASDDQIAVYYTGMVGEKKVQGWLAYGVTERSDENKTATFSLLSNQSSKAAAFEEQGLTATGVAVYPVTSARPYAAYGNTMDIPYSQDVPIVTMNATAGTSIPNIGLTGAIDGGIYKFKTAGSVIKVTLNHVHSNATSISLVTNDKEHYPVTGDFILTPTNGVYAYTFGDGSAYKYYSDFSDNLKVNISPSSNDATITVYFNIPVGSYSENKLAINIEEKDGEHVRVISKKIGKPLTTFANELLSLPSLDLTYNTSITVTGSSDNPQMTWTANSLRFCVLTTNTNDVSKYVSGMRFSVAETNRSWGLTGAKYNNGGTATTSLSSTGKYYLHYALKRNSGDTSDLTSLLAGDVVEYGTIPFYFISSDDVTAFAKQYSFTKTDGTNFWHPGTGSNYATTMTLAVSDDVTKGNLMISELYGKDGANKKVYGVLGSSDATSMTFAYNGDNSGQQFFYQNGNYFHIAQGTTHDATASTGDIVFTIASGPVLTCENYLMMKYTSNYSSWNEFISGVGLVFN